MARVDCVVHNDDTDDIITSQEELLKLLHKLEQR